MSDPLYRKEILRLAADAHGAGRLPQPDLIGHAHNPTCGDRISIGLTVDDAGRVATFAHETKACVLTQASASILGERLKGAALADIEALANAVAAMLVSNAESPPSPFDSYVAFQGAVTHRNRHCCVLLPIEAVLDAFEQEPNQAA
ncbi:MAG: iron-sulfur cluster assembly scaffold protein [Alphaproteobacteria bacterium]